MANTENVIIIGSGPAGHTAAIYTSRANLQPVLFEGEMAGGIAAGGQLTTTNEVENFPGFTDGINGFELMFKIRAQSEKYGTKIITKTIDKVDLQTYPFKVFYGTESLEAKSLIIATGSIAKRLNLPGEDIYWQKGISACAVCDGGLPLFRDKHLIVMGGGDTAVEEALHLSKFGSQITLLVRRDVLRASKIMQEKVMSNPKIQIVWNSNAIEVLGAELLQKVKIKNSKTEQQSIIEASGLFYAIGHKPNTGFLDNQLQLDNEGYIITEPGSAKTSKKGVFACGDVQDKIYRQAVVAAGSGCMAALEAEKYL
ncbi:thioredoxin-disulfide reductase [Candidatus Margulisiibacteriota bacterium]